MKAAKRFKALVHKNRPDLVNSILGSASRFVQPPTSIGSFSTANASDPNLETPIRQQSITEEDVNAAQAALDREGDSTSARLVSQLSKLPEKIRTAAVSLSDDSPTLPTSPRALRKTQTEPVPVDHMRGHAHDPLQDEIFLNIGGGPQAQGFDGAEDDAERSYSVCESPGATGFNVYEKAYREEVQRIYVRQGREATIYLTRRVEDKAKEKWKGFSDEHGGAPGPSASTGDRFKSGFVKAVNKTMEAGRAAKSSYDQERSDD